MQALILVDIQNDFCPGGSLPVPDGDAIVSIANRLIPKFDIVVATQDFHPPAHSSFVDQGGPWPSHCVQGTTGADFHSDLAPVEHIFPKGTRMDQDSYSGFADDGGNETGIDFFLKGGHNVDEVFIMGLATDYCVKATVLHALERGYKVSVVVDGCRGVNINPGDAKAALDNMAAAGAHLVWSRELG